MQPVEHDSLANASMHNSQADAGLAEQALADFAKSQQLSRKNAAQLIFGHDQADPKGKSFGDCLSSQTKCNTMIRCCHYGKRISTFHAGRPLYDCPTS